MDEHPWGEKWIDDSFRHFKNRINEFVNRNLYNWACIAAQYAIDDSKPIIEIRDINFCFGWTMGYGCVDLVLYKHKTYRTPVYTSNLDVTVIDYRFLGQKDYWSDYITPSVIEVASVLEQQIAKRLGWKNVTWKNHLRICESPIHDHNGPWGPEVNLCYKFGERFLCHDCRNAFSLTESITPASNETKKEKSEREKMTSSLRYSILERDNFTCKTCGRQAGDGVNLHVDHIVPIAEGGKTVDDNLQVLCQDCNLGKGAKMPAQSSLEFMKGGLRA